MNYELSLSHKASEARIVSSSLLSYVFLDAFEAFFLLEDLLRCGRLRLVVVVVAAFAFLVFFAGVVDVLARFVGGFELLDRVLKQALPCTAVRVNTLHEEHS
jgi:hypothetical protein